MLSEDDRESIKWRIMDLLHIHDYGMFSIRGNAEVSAMVKQANTLPAESQQNFVTAEMKRIAKRHPEVFDTDVRESIQEMCPGYSAYAFDW